MTQYALGLSSPPTPLSQFNPVVPEPMISQPELYPLAFDDGDGGQAGHGSPRTTWIFQVLTEEEKKALQAIVTNSGVILKSRSVYIVTRTFADMDVFAEYTAKMIWPGPDVVAASRQVNGLYLDFPILFRKLLVAV